MSVRQQLFNIYKRLLSSFGEQKWWPGEGFEIPIGAILTQQTSWTNVEKALANLKEQNVLSLKSLRGITIAELETLIRPSGYYRVKARRLKNFIEFINQNSSPSREELLKINGLGQETTDSILLYWLNQPYFVIDTYTFRIFQRLGLYIENWNYSKMQKFFMNNLPKDVRLYNEYHALIVKQAKDICTKSKPKCNICSLSNICAYNRDSKSRSE